MEYQIQKTIFSVHELIVEKELFNEKKEYEAWLKPGSEDLQDMVCVLHFFRWRMIITRAKIILFVNFIIA